MSQHHLRFESLRDPREVLDFACDASGVADMDAMDHATRNRYLFVRALTGIDYSVRCVRRARAPAFESGSMALETQ